MKDDFFAAPLTKRLRIARKLVTRNARYLVIPRKPHQMIQPRSGDHVMAPVREAIERDRATIDALTRDLKPFVDEWFARVDRGAASAGTSHFGTLDSAYAYAMVRHFAPATILEVGCGQSTLVMHVATEKSAADGGTNTRIICVDPAPRQSIEAVADQIFYASVLDVVEQRFTDLKAGDFLFIDGSHYSFNGTDATYLFLEILPHLKAGVIVHVHDIFLPFEYPPEFTRRLYNEQYVLAALLMDTASWEILLPVHADARAGRLGDGEQGGSFWLRRR